MIFPGQPNNHLLVNDTCVVLILFVLIYKIKKNYGFFLFRHLLLESSAAFLIPFFWTSCKSMSCFCHTSIHKWSLEQHFVMIGNKALLSSTLHKNKLNIHLPYGSRKISKVISNFVIHSIVPLGERHDLKFRQIWILLNSLRMFLLKLSN